MAAARARTAPPPRPSRPGPGPGHRSRHLSGRVTTATGPRPAQHRPVTRTTTPGPRRTHTRRMTPTSLVLRRRGARSHTVRPSRCTISPLRPHPHPLPSKKQNHSLRTCLPGRSCGEAPGYIIMSSPCANSVSHVPAACVYCRRSVSQDKPFRAGQAIGCCPRPGRGRLPWSRGTALLPDLPHALSTGVYAVDSPRTWCVRGNTGA